MKRLRTFLLIAILILIVAVVILVVLPQLNAPQQTIVDDTGEVVAVVQNPESTPLPTATPIRYVDLVVAVQNISRGQVIPPDAVVVNPWPEDAQPFNGISNLDDVVGRIARTDIFREQPILSNMVVDSYQSLARVGSDAAAILPQGLVAVALPIDRLTSVGYAVQDGDRVDLIMSLLFVDVDEDFQSRSPNDINLIQITEDGIDFIAPIAGRPDSTSLGQVIISPSEQQRPRLVTQRTITDALVIHMGTIPPDGRFIGVPPTPTPAPSDGEEEDTGTPVPTPTPARPDIIILGVTPQDAVFITWMIEARVPVTLALRSAQDTSTTVTNEVTLDYLMTEFGIALPGKRPYAIEPAIRSIRQLIAGDEIGFGTSE